MMEKAGTFSTRASTMQEHQLTAHGGMLTAGKTPSAANSSKRTTIPSPPGCSRPEQGHNVTAAGINPA